MKEIKLTQGKVALVDDEDYEYLNQWKWCAAKRDKTYYAVRGIYLGQKKYKIILMHRVILNTPDGMQVDHCDHSGLNNQRYNLRNATHSQNRKNKSAWGSSKYLGVCIQQTGKRKGEISAHIRNNGKQKFLGYFKTEEDAARAYDTMAKEVHGEFSNINFK